MGAKILSTNSGFWEFWSIYTGFPGTDGSFWDETSWLWATQITKDTKGWLWVERGAGFNNKKTLGWYCYFSSGIRIAFTCASTWHCSKKGDLFCLPWDLSWFITIFREYCLKCVQPTIWFIVSFAPFCGIWRNKKKNLPKGLRTEGSETTSPEPRSIDPIDQRGATGRFTSFHGSIGRGFRCLTWNCLMLLLEHGIHFSAWSLLGIWQKHKKKRILRYYRWKKSG